MNDLEEYEQLKEDETKIEKKMAEEITPKELEKLYYELDTISKRKAKIRKTKKYVTSDSIPSNDG